VISWRVNISLVLPTLRLIVRIKASITYVRRLAIAATEQDCSNECGSTYRHKHEFVIAILRVQLLLADLFGFAGEERAALTGSVIDKLIAAEILAKPLTDGCAGIGILGGFEYYPGDAAAEAEQN